MKLSTACFFISLAFSCAWEGIVSGDDNTPIDTYTVKKGENLWIISEKILGDGSRWPEIWKKNPSIQNPHLIISGDVLDVGSLRIIPIQDKETEVILSNLDIGMTSPGMVNAPVHNTGGESAPGEQNQTPFEQKADNDIALDFLMSSLINDLKNVLSQNDSLSNTNNSISRIGTTAQHPRLPVFSLIFVPNRDLLTKDKYFVGDSEAFIISRGKVLPVDEIPETSVTCDKVRKVAQKIEDQGKYLFFDETTEGYINHIKMMIFSDDEHFYYSLLTNVDELSPTLFFNKEPLDVLRIRVFSKKGYIYFTDKGLQGFPGYFYAADEFGVPIDIDPNDPIIVEKYEKTLESILELMTEKDTQKTDPRIKEKLNQIF